MKGLRGLIAHFSQIGIPAQRVALELQFQSALGDGGRNGLQPKQAWFEIVKEEAHAHAAVGCAEQMFEQDLASQILVPCHPLLELNDFQRIRRRCQRLGQQWIWIKRDGRN